MVRMKNCRASPLSSLDKEESLACQITSPFNKKIGCICFNSLLLNGEVIWQASDSSLYKELHVILAAISNNENSFALLVPEVFSPSRSWRSACFRNLVFDEYFVLQTSHRNGRIFPSKLWSLLRWVLSFSNLRNLSEQIWQKSLVRLFGFDLRFADLTGLSDFNALTVFSDFEWFSGWSCFEEFADWSGLDRFKG